MSRTRTGSAGILLAGVLVAGAALTGAGAAQAAGAVPAAPHAAGRAPGGTRPAAAQNYTIVNDHAGKCAEVDGNGRLDPGTLVHEWSCDGELNQVWRPIDLGNGFFLLENTGSGYCMSVTEPVDGAQLDQEACNASLPQESWQLRPADGVGHLWLASGLSSECIALFPNTSKNGTAVVINGCSTTSGQFWHLSQA